MIGLYRRATGLKDCLSLTPSQAFLISVSFLSSLPRGKGLGYAALVAIPTCLAWNVAFRALSQEI